MLADTEEIVTTTETDSNFEYEQVSFQPDSIEDKLNIKRFKFKRKKVKP